MAQKVNTVIYCYFQMGNKLICWEQFQYVIEVLSKTDIKAYNIVRDRVPPAAPSYV